jgi:uncharacterized protein YjbI with pentapeptide repeats
MPAPSIDPERPDIQEVLDAETGTLTDDAVIDASLFSGTAHEPVCAKGIAVEGSKIVESVLAGSILRAPRFVDCVFERADCASASWTDARIVRSVFTGCKLTGFDARGTEFRDVTFSECKMPDSFLVESTLTRVRFDSCKLNGLDLCGAKIKSVAIHSSDARNLRLQGAKIDTLDLRGSLIDGISLDPGSVAHLLIDPTQGGAIAQALGARVREIDHR